MRAARFPVLKTLNQFCWDWPKKINRLAVQNLFRLEFLAQPANVVFLGTVGLGKTHLATALGYAACLEGQSVLFATAIERHQPPDRRPEKGRPQKQLKKYLAPDILILDELGYLPIDQHGADLLFQVISRRYERGSIVLTTNKPFKQWAAIFNNDSTLASAVPRPLLHHAETVVIEGPSFRMKDQIQRADGPPSAPFLHDSTPAFHSAGFLLLWAIGNNLKPAFFHHVYAAAHNRGNY